MAETKKHVGGVGRCYPVQGLRVDHIAHRVRDANARFYQHQLDRVAEGDFVGIPATSLPTRKPRGIHAVWFFACVLGGAVLAYLLLNH